MIIDRCVCHYESDPPCPYCASGEKRDLHADLAICNAATPGPWALDYDCEDRKHCVEAVNIPSWGGGVIVADCAEEEDARFIAEARTGWPHAIERALAAEAERDELRKIVSEECPIAAFDLVTSLRAEKAHMVERIAELEAGAERLRSVLTQIHLTRHDKGEIDRD